MSEKGSFSMEIVELFHIADKANEKIERLVHDVLKFHNVVYPDNMLQLNYSFDTPVKLRYDDDSGFFVKIRAQSINDGHIEYIICSTGEFIDPHIYQERIEEEKDFRKREDARLALYRAHKSEFHL